MPLANFMSCNPPLVRVLSMLEDSGHSAHLVGGAVRNTLMDMSANDLDIATSADPDTVALLFDARGYIVRPTGLEHGTLTVVVDDVPFEITTWRRDVSTDGRRATVAYANSLHQDARRRDFTINALYADRRGAIIDPTGQGLRDIRDCRIAFIGNPADRIREDTLRILRFYRFSATHGNGVDPASIDAQACKALGSLIAQLPGERVGQEMRKLLGADKAGPIVAPMKPDGILDTILDVTPSDDVISKRLDMLRSAEIMLNLAPDPMRRLAVLAEGANLPIDALRLSKAETQQLRRLKKAATNSAGPAELGYRLGRDQALDALAIRYVLDTTTRIDATTFPAVDLGAASVFPINGQDLKDRFSGPALGAALRDLEATWISSDFAMNRDDLLARAPLC